MFNKNRILFIGNSGDEDIKKYYVKHAKKSNKDRRDFEEVHVEK